MIVEIKVPSVGESVTEAILAQWFKADGDLVKKGEALFVIETDKVTLEVESEAEGKLAVTVAEGETVAIGAVVGTIDTEAAAAAETAAAGEEVKAAVEEEKEPAAPAPAATTAAEPAPTAPPPPPPVSQPAAEPAPPPADVILSPAVRRLVAEKGLDVSQIQGTGPAGRITKGDVVLFLEASAGAVQQPAAAVSPPAAVGALPPEAAELTSRKPMTPIRQRIASRLLEAKQNTAMLTTFNDVDMSRVMAMRSQYKEAFQKKHGVALGFMSFFIKASVEALKEFPEINAFIDGK